MNIDLEQISAQVEAALMARTGSKREGDELRFRCVQHADENASAGYNAVKRCWKCHGCGNQGGVKSLAKLLGIAVAKSRARTADDLGPIVATYDYTDNNGELLYQAVRFQRLGREKTFRQRRPNGHGEWTWNLTDVRLVLYRLPDVLAAIRAGRTVHIVEGEKDVDTLRGLGLVATCNPMGAGKWRPEYSEMLREADVVVLPDQDDPGLAHGAAVARALTSAARSVRVVHMPDAKDVTDWLNAGHTKDELLALISSTDHPVARTLDDVLTVFQRRLYLPDPAALYALLGTIAANRMAGAPIWLLIVGPPGSGKTELLQSVHGLPNMHAVGTLTEPALLSGTPRREKASDAKGGLLREIGDFGFIICKDFTSILSMHRDARAAVLAALREVFDGTWVRVVGVDGGRKLEWKGKVGLIAGCTPTVDSHHSVIATMGERFVFCRLPTSDSRQQGLRALQHVSTEMEMRHELADVVSDLFAALTVPTHFPALTEDEQNHLVDLSALAVRCRSAVERDSYRREIDLVPEPEAPTRLALTLARLMLGMRAVGVQPADVWRVTIKCALDSMPQLRRAVFTLLLDKTGRLDTTAIAQSTGYPTITARRGCEDLAAHGIVERFSAGKGKSDEWRLTDWARERYDAVMAGVSEMSGEGTDRTFSEMSDGNGHPTFSEMSGGKNCESKSLSYLQHTIQDDKTEKVPSEDDPAAFYADAREDVG